MSRTETFSRLQERAWAHYGWAGSNARAVGEVRYVIGWHADQMTRLDWDVYIDGSDDWVVPLPATDNKPARSISTKRDDGEQDQTAASAELLDLIGWTDTTVRAVDTNLFVAGQGDYIQTPKDKWRVVSVMEAGRRDTIKEARQSVEFLWPHPADPRKPDAPLFAVLELLDELDWLNRQARTQSKQRVHTTGILGIADGFNGPEGADFWTNWNAAMSAKMTNPDDMSPIALMGSAELIKDGLNWVTPKYEYDNVVDRRALAAIQRLAYGLPIPPEVLLGMQAQSRATAFQVEENSYRAHIEPPAMMVAQVAEDALKLVLEDGTKVTVVPNPSRLLARRNSVEDVKWAREQGLVDPDYVREVLGIPEDAAPEDNDGVPIATTPVERDPANVAADPPVTAAASTGPDLSTLLADIDAALSSELAGATVAATDWARRRLGAQARTVEAVRNNGARDMTNDQLATHLGLSGLTAAGVNVPDRIAEPVDAATKWWVKRVGQAWEQAATLVPGWSGQGDWVSDSVDVLATSLASHITDTLTDSDPGPLDAESIRRVVDAAAGGN